MPVITVAPVVVRPDTALEYRVGDRHLGLVEEQERNRAREAEDPPECDDDEETVAEPELAAVAAHRQPEDDPASENQRHRDRERDDVAVFVDPRDRERRHHGQAEQPEQEPEDALNGEPVHARGSGGLTRRLRRCGRARAGPPGCVAAALAADRFPGVRSHRA